MNKHDVDLLVIGAGATGACIAYEACRRGLKVALLEAGDIGSGTSCRSTKLLHGGVRYLELAFKNLDFGQLKLVREALLERKYWLEKTPFLAHRLELVLPTKDCIGKAYYRAGLGLYDALSGGKSIGSSHIISKSQLNRALPRLNDDLNGGVAYYDGQFDDSRLNLLLALTAEKGGAILRTRCKVIELEHQPNGKLSGVVSQDIFKRQERWTASAVVNATGINVDSIRQLAQPDATPRILASRGVHVVLEEKLCPEGIGLILPATDDGRVLFILPFFGRTQIGTTDTPCSIKEAKTPSKSEQEYLISHVKRWFPSLKELTIKSTWAGGRPLLKPPEEEISRSSSSVVREHEIETLPCGLISAMGGKWTTCRQIALDTLKAVESLLGPLPPKRQLPIIGSNNQLDQLPNLLLKQQDHLREYLPKTHLLAKQIGHLQSNYGLDALSIISKSAPDKLNPLSETIPVCQAEIEHSILNEYAMTATDILARRCRLAMVDLTEANRLLPIVQNLLRDKNTLLEDLNLEN